MEGAQGFLLPAVLDVAADDARREVQLLRNAVERRGDGVSLHLLPR